LSPCQCVGQGKCFEHRKPIVEARIRQLGEIFAVSVYAYAVMSNHLHVVLQTLPEVVAVWSDDEIAARWMRLFPRQDVNPALQAEVLAGNPERLAVLRGRLANLSWFMRCLSEPIARAANRECTNREDICKGWFWEGRFRCQVLLDQTAVIAAMAYVDLNPVRAEICETLEDSAHTSARNASNRRRPRRWRRLLAFAALLARQFDVQPLSTLGPVALPKAANAAVLKNPRWRAPARRVAGVVAMKWPT